MLNKKICKKCINSTQEYGWNETNIFETGVEERIRDEELWEKHKAVYCIDETMRQIDIIPTNCPYYLEHIMENEECN